MYQIPANINNKIKFQMYKMCGDMKYVITLLHFPQKKNNNQFEMILFPTAELTPSIRNIDFLPLYMEYISIYIEISLKCGLKKKFEATFFHMTMNMKLPNLISFLKIFLSVII